MEGCRCEESGVVGSRVEVVGLEGGILTSHNREHLLAVSTLFRQW